MVHRRSDRNRNNYVLLIVAGLFLLTYYTLGFVPVAALMLIALGVYFIRTDDNKKGGILLALGSVTLIVSHFGFVVFVILFSLSYFYINSRKVQREGAYMKRHNLLESLRCVNEPWVARSLSCWHLVGEVNLDFSLAIPEAGETTIVLQGIVGDVNIIVPEYLGLYVDSSVLLGRLGVVGDKKAGALNAVKWWSPNYAQSETKVHLIVSYVLGDVEIKVI